MDIFGVDSIIAHILKDAENVLEYIIFESGPARAAPSCGSRKTLKDLIEIKTLSAGELAALPVSVSFPESVVFGAPLLIAQYIIGLAYLLDTPLGLFFVARVSIGMIL